MSRRMRTRAIQHQVWSRTSLRLARCPAAATKKEARAARWSLRALRPERAAPRLASPRHLATDLASSPSNLERATRRVRLRAPRSPQDTDQPDTRDQSI